jgi:hypothetical protein
MTLSPKSVLASGALIFTLVLSVSACGPTPPQAPLPYAQKLDAATGGISTACGEAAEVTAFPGPHPDLATLEHNAALKVRKLVVVYRRNRRWIYQGETVSELVKGSDSMLATCGLHQAERLLRRLTR